MCNIERSFREKLQFSQKKPDRIACVSQQETGNRKQADLAFWGLFYSHSGFGVFYSTRQVRNKPLQTVLTICIAYICKNTYYWAFHTR